ncbi:hypothetical protein V8F06_013338 [Rhypophila decipiens]
MGKKKRAQAPQKPVGLPEFDFSKLCAAWAGLRDDGKQLPIRILECKLKCKGCTLAHNALLAIRRLGNVEGLVRYTKYKHASFLVITWPYVGTFVIYAQEGVPNTWKPKGQPLGFDQNLNATKDAVCDWLNTCLKKHKRCGPGPLSKLSTRVLDVRFRFYASHPFLISCTSARSLSQTSSSCCTHNLLRYRSNKPNRDPKKQDSNTSAGLTFLTVTICSPITMTFQFPNHSNIHQCRFSRLKPPWHSKQCPVTTIRAEKNTKENKDDRLGSIMLDVDAPTAVLDPKYRRSHPHPRPSLYSLYNVAPT